MDIQLGRLALAYRTAMNAHLRDRGEFAEWGLGPARLFKKNGGERVLFACGRAHCELAAKGSANALEAASLLSQIIYVQGAGHTYGDGMEQPLRTAFAWLVEGDPRWQ